MHHVHLKDAMQVTTVYFVLLPLKKVNTESIICCSSLQNVDMLYFDSLTRKIDTNRRFV